MGVHEREGRWSRFPEIHDVPIIDFLPEEELAKPDVVGQFAGGRVYAIGLSADLVDPLLMAFPVPIPLGATHDRLEI